MEKLGGWRAWLRPAGGSLSSLFVPNPSPASHPMLPLCTSFQREHPESDSTKPCVRQWESAALQPTIETRGVPAKSMMRQK